MTLHTFIPVATCSPYETRSVDAIPQSEPTRTIGEANSHILVRREGEEGVLHFLFPFFHKHLGKNKFWLLIMNIIC